VTYPDPQQTPEQVTVGYNTQGSGLPNLLTSNVAGNPNPVDSATYNERGQLATLGQGTSGNGNYLTTTFTYDDASTSHSWLTEVQATSNNRATTLLDLSMGNTLNGNVSSVSQKASGDPNNPTFTNSFAYDGLDRLRVVTSTLYLNGIYTFDTLGRMTSRNIGGTNYTLAYSDTAHIDAPTSYSRTGSYGYDDNGNQTSGTVNGAGQTRSVDAENRVTQVVTGTVAATTLTFVYDANGKRIMQTIAPQLGTTSRTLYIGTLYEEDITNGSTGSSPYISYFYLGMKLVGMRRANQTAGNGQYRIVGDHLGSTSMIVDCSSPPNAVQWKLPPFSEAVFHHIPNFERESG
jgi:YD repeat-containing protein